MKTNIRNISYDFPETYPMTYPTLKKAYSYLKILTIEANMNTKKLSCLFKNGYH